MIRDRIVGACSSQCVRIVLKGNVVSREVFTLTTFMVFLKALIFYILCNSLEYCSLTFVSQFASAIPCSAGLYLEWFVGSLPFLPSCALQKRAPAHYHVSPILPPPRTQGDVSKANTKCPLPLRASALLGSGRHDFFFSFRFFHFFSA